MSADLCNIHYIDVLQCAFCCLLDTIATSLICKRHLLCIVGCSDCIRIIHNHNCLVIQKQKTNMIKQTYNP